MKRFPLLISFLLPATLILTLPSCEVLESGLSDDEIIAGLKEALTVGTDTAVTKSSSNDGYFLHPVNKILMPPEAEPVVNTVSSLPGGDLLVEEAVLKMNRAAESAAKAATPIFVDAIVGLTITDGLDILQGNDNAATAYLENNTRTGLYSNFKPEIESALQSVGAQQAWTEVFDLYNSIPFISPVNPDLADHTTNRGLDGLFLNVEEEEGKIRNDVSHRVSETLEKVFAEQD